MKSEIRPSQINDLSERVRRNKYAEYLKSMRLVKIRGFSDTEITFDFPVTALIGPNGSGKTTVLGAAGLLYKSVSPRRFFAKSGRYDDSMQNWKIEYTALSENMKSGTSITRTASFRQAKWNRDALTRSVLVIGIDRTLPATERKNLNPFIGNNFKGSEEHTFSQAIVDAVQKILGKNADNYLSISADKTKTKIFAMRDESTSSVGYSEFHFGAGEASIIRIVSEIEEAQDGCLMLIEEIENGLHPLAVRRLVEYLIDVAKRKSTQVVFTTHSNAALEALPDDAVWSCYDGKVKQGKLDIEALRTLTGEVECQAAVFTEDSFGAVLADITLRKLKSQGVKRSSIEIHHMSGADSAYQHVAYHNSNPTSSFPAIALLDGDMKNNSKFSTKEIKAGDLKFTSTVFCPGDSHPEVEIFEDVYAKLTQILGKLTQRLTLDTDSQTQVKKSIETRRSTCRDPHLLFAQIAEDLDFLPTDTVERAFITIWCDSFPEKVERMWEGALPCLVSQGIRE
ncbi:ATP-dependent nuclease [Actinomyces capricornis]|uniref:AAA+ ATPase domain-containing protein n=1 Tax=Actinomyces capricornis TaxID=2755559 RepID=A0ABN6K7N2_9ACTO|nr:AAA family ATPase [Actinomyces capricornis]BDA65287.1 hypothetical protein MANAM107_21210 [Actinomyces capricornis]